MRLSDQAISILKDLPRDCRFVFPGKDGTKPRADLKKPWAAVTRHAELNGLRIHDLRHSFASFAAASGVSLQAIGKLLGHKSIKSTERYAHLAEDPLRNAASEVGATIHRYANNA
ncbi:MAG: site-specific integrase [Martelella sp.]|uniref:site-specific integrase n=1 Tax=Martelella sp. TaxID=1969699 RepID=UPI0032422DED